MKIPYNNIGTYLNDTFGIKEFKPMFLGGTLIDTDHRTGYSPSEISNFSKYKATWTPISTLNLYPEAEAFEKEDNKSTNISMRSCWINGFIPYMRGLANVTGISRNCSNYFMGKSVIILDQVLMAKADDHVSCLLNNFSWYGSTNRLTDNGKTSIDMNSIDDMDSANKKLLHKGLVCSNWSKNPLPVRYMVHLKKNSTGIDNDYVYLIGGSDDIIGDNIDDIPSKLCSILDKIKSLQEDSKKSSKLPDISKYNEGFKSSSDFVWWSYPEDSCDHPIVQAHLLAKKAYRMIEGIIFIRNYLVYAKKDLCITELKELSWEGGHSVIKIVNIDDVIKKYDIMYAYCKNLCYVFKNNIGNCTLL
jgi:hypothetical protein